MKIIIVHFLIQFAQGGVGILKGSDTPSRSWKQLFETRSKVRLFLMQFLDHCSENEDYIIKEQHILEKLWDVLFVDAKDKSVFYIGTTKLQKFLVMTY